MLKKKTRTESGNEDNTALLERPSARPTQAKTFNVLLQTEHRQVNKDKPAFSYCCGLKEILYKPLLQHSAQNNLETFGALSALSLPVIWDRCN